MNPPARRPRRQTVWYVLAFALLVGAPARSAPAPPAERLALTGLSVVDVVTGTVTEGQTILIEGGRIVYLANRPDSTRLATTVVHDHPLYTGARMTARQPASTQEAPPCATDPVESSAPSHCSPQRAPLARTRTGST